MQTRVDLQEDPAIRRGSPFQTYCSWLFQENSRRPAENQLRGHQNLKHSIVARPPGCSRREAVMAGVSRSTIDAWHSPQTCRNDDYFELSSSREAEFT